MVVPYGRWLIPEIFLLTGLMTIFLMEALCKCRCGVWGNHFNVIASNCLRQRSIHLTCKWQFCSDINVCSFMNGNDSLYGLGTTLNSFWSNYGSIWQIQNNDGLVILQHGVLAISDRYQVIRPVVMHKWQRLCATQNLEWYAGDWLLLICDSFLDCPLTQ